MTLQIEVAPEVETTLIEAAEHEGLTVSELLVQTVAYVYSEEHREREILRERVAYSERGDVLTKEEMDARLARMLRR
jgi:hypothetical protein